MSRLLITVNKRLWDKELLPSFVQPGDITADCLMSLRVTDNSMSVWEVTGDDANLERVLTALAANRDHPTNIDYLIFDSNIPASLGLEVIRRPGATPDVDANEAWHRDLVDISGRKLLGFAVEVFQNSTRRRCPGKDVLRLLKEAFRRKEIDRERIPPTLLQKIENGLQL
ncbi:hypothetical protein [Acidicapsa acidisoli]|uniref:hypothetical protein n=1 Tax=Acidicapsa acidisoli TaxID=1615681 RepID=UPI0021E035C6|nr:hypothetical protein [Acidicapsa acidisoli]